MTGLPRPDQITVLYWDEAIEEHIAEHVHPWLVQDMVEARRFLVFPNHDGHPPDRFLVIGPTEPGKWITAVLERNQQMGLWIPVSGRISTSTEQRKWREKAPKSWR